MGSNGGSSVSHQSERMNEAVSEAELELKIRIMQYARSERRVQEVVRVKQKKIKIQSFSNGLNHRGSFCGVQLGFEFFAESPCELRSQCSLTSDRCLGARVSDPPLSPMIFFLRLAPRGFFLQ